jgi:hypothetical protein
VLVPGCHGGMFDHNTMRVLTSFHIVFLTFNLCFRQISSDSSKGATVMIVHAIALYYQKDIILA